MVRETVLMAISLATHKRLWGNAGRLCAYPGCGQPLLIPMETGEDEFLIGKECHIIAKADSGPRNPTSLSDEEAKRWKPLVDDRDSYGNLILLCGVHHDVIDGDVAAHSVAMLVEMKRTHERIVSEQQPPNARQEEDLQVRYASIVDEWARRIVIDRWDGRMSRLVSDAAIQEEVLEELERVRMWLLSRVWPRTIPALEAAFFNFRLVAEDMEAVTVHFSSSRNGLLLVDRVYQEVGYGVSSENHEFLKRRSEYHQDLVADLAVELTRAVNLICDRVRAHLWPSYRLDEGRTTIGLGINSSLVYQTLVPLYEPNCPDVPYPGLREFLSERADRDWARGTGSPPKGAGVPGLGDS